MKFKSNGDGTYRVSSHVYSQNLFGAMLRTEYAACVDAAGNVQSLVMEDALGNIEIGDGENFISDSFQPREDFGEQWER